MSLDFIVYCKKEADVERLAETLGVPVKDIYDYGKRRWLQWEPIEKQNIEIVFGNRPTIPYNEYNKEEIGERVKNARVSGHEIPECLIGKLKRDRLIVLAELEKKSGNGGIFDDCDDYFLRADRELYKFLSTYPHLENVLPELFEEFQVVKFSGGTFYLELS